MQKLLSKTIKAAMQAKLQPIVLQLLAAEVIAEDMRTKCDAITRQVLAMGDYKIGLAFPKAGERITEPKETWTVDLRQSDELYARLHEAKTAAGLDTTNGTCPALVAESAVIGIRRTLCDAITEFIPELSYDRVSHNVGKIKELCELLKGLAFAR